MVDTTDYCTNWTADPSMSLPVNLANFIVSGGSLIQSKYQHQVNLENEEELFKKEMKQMEDEHKKVSWILFFVDSK